MDTLKEFYRLVTQVSCFDGGKMYSSYASDDSTVDMQLATLLFFVVLSQALFCLDIYTPVTVSKLRCYSLLAGLRTGGDGAMGSVPG
jgi:hypothetical protein